MKVIKGEPMVEMGKEEVAILRRLGSRTSVAESAVYGLLRLFTEADFVDGEWTFKDRKTVVSSKSAMKRNFAEIRKALKEATDILTELELALSQAQ